MPLRHLQESDYDRIIAVLDLWWGGRQMALMLPRLFFSHFHDTGFVWEEAGEPLAFLCGFISQASPEQAYVHFIGVHPDHRRRGLAGQLYEAFFATVRRRGCREVHCVTSTVNTASVAFHRRIGFQVKPGGCTAGKISYFPDYDGPGEDRVVFVKNIC